MPSGRTYQGQLYQTATAQFTITTETGFSYTFKTWEELKLDYGAESKIANNTDGSIAGFTTDPVKTSAGVKIRLDEWDDVIDAWTTFNKTTRFLQQVFDFSAVCGNSIQRRRNDSGKIKFQKDARDFPKGSDPLMVDCPLLLLDFLNNGVRPIDFPV